jgi:uncharacterized membrane protein
MSDRALTRALAVLAAVGLGIAAYLTYVHYAGVAPVCTAGGGCETVQTSRWSELAGMPVALLGLCGYVAVLVTLSLRGETARLATAGVAATGAGFSLYLTYLELFTIHAVCVWCVASAVIMCALAALALLRALRLEDPAPPLAGLAA